VPVLDIAYPQQFYARSTIDVAKDLLGAVLCRRLPTGEILTGRIVETEAYRDNEPASHAFRGITPRSKVMFGPPGVSYVYFIYGVYHCLNVVTELPGRGCAVLIRALEGEHTNGPGKICKHFSITREQNALDLTVPATELWIAPSDAVLSKSEIGISPRIGVTAAEDLPWRFFIKNHKSVSGPKAFNSAQYIITPATARRSRQLAQA
jgi:DNA-3-methyladenine glycosylase